MPTDSVSFNFAKIEVEYRPQNPDGSFGAAVHHKRDQLMRRLKQFDGIAVWVFQLNLLSARTRLHVIAKVKTGLFQTFNPS